MDKNLHDSLIKTIQILVDDAINKTQFTSSQIGLIKEINGYDCTVELFGADITCKMLKHLINSITVGDIVIVQDLYNDSTKRYVVSKIGEATNG